MRKSDAAISDEPDLSAATVRDVVQWRVSWRRDARSAWRDLATWVEETWARNDVASFRAEHPDYEVRLQKLTTTIECVAERPAATVPYFKEKAVMRITLSHYTREGSLRHCVLIDGCAHTAETDREVAERIAHRVYEEHHGHAALVEWDGDLQVESTLAEK